MPAIARAVLDQRPVAMRYSSWTGVRDRKESASLRVSSLGRERLAKLGAYAVQALEQSGPPSEDGWTEIELPIENVEQAALAMLGIGPEVEIAGPPTLRARVGELARQIAALAE